MSAPPREPNAPPPPVNPAVLDKEVQGLVLTTYRATHSRNLILKVREREPARRFIGELLKRRLLTFGPSERRSSGSACAINIGFTFAGLRALGAPKRLLDDLDDKSHAFGEGPTTRAAACLGDAGESAAERWDSAFAPEHAHVWIAVYGSAPTHIQAALADLQTLPGAMAGLEGWMRPETALDGAHLLDPDQPSVRRVHFGLRDNLTKPSIIDTRPASGQTDRPPRSAPGELLLGYPNDAQADVWTGSKHTQAEIAHFLRNGSFGVLRKIQQYEGRLAAFLETQVQRQQDAGHDFVTAAYLKAKMCGRWPNGAPLQPGVTVEPPAPNGASLRLQDFSQDQQGEGCPFGAHIRRAHPRDDPLFPQRSRVLFRRGIPYGTEYLPTAGAPPLSPEEIDRTDRGLLGIFFCARIEDQFEQLISEWLEKNPLGPPNQGRAKDPLLGNHDEPLAEFHIPLKDSAPMVLSGFDPFVRTRGTLYAMFPSRTALAIMAHGAQWDLAFGMPIPAPDAAPVPDAPASTAARAPASAVPRPPTEDKPLDFTAEESRAVDPKEIAHAAMAAPSDRFCDVVMEGGITSGIIYASAVVELGRHYRFQSIGGSSIGAFGAALTAAAEFRRRHGWGDGFARLALLPDKLAQEDDDGRTQLERLFVPEPRTRRLFQIFLATLERGSRTSLLAAGFAQALRQYRGWIALSVTLTVLGVLAGPFSTIAHCLSGASGDATWACRIGLFSWTLATVIALLATVVGTLFLGIGHDLLRGMVRNGFGLCRGWSKDASLDPPDLAGYLHASIQQVAGRHVLDDPPLTFADLWNAPGCPTQALGLARNIGPQRSINLEMYTSNLTHGRPYRFPLDTEATVDRLFFREKELLDYFPARIVQYLVSVSEPYAKKAHDDPDHLQVGAGFYELPVDRLPIVIAVRMAMSFPGLISAVPLFAIDRERKRKTLSRCWMSDGGLCSNFPIHLFDSFVPMWPTFGIALYTRPESDDRRVRLPDLHTEGAGDEWNHEPDAAGTRTGRLVAFLKAIWLTTWHWNDSTMMRMPGVRERVVRVYLAPGEGGVNIRMRADRIRVLGTEYGREAARAFISKFAEPTSPGWHEHRWVRFNTLLLAVRERLRDFSAAAGMNHHTVPLAQQIAAAASAPPLRGAHPTDPAPSEAPLDAGQIVLLESQLKALEGIAAAFGKIDVAMDVKDPKPPFHPVPKPNLRMRHPT